MFLDQYERRPFYEFQGIVNQKNIKRDKTLSINQMGISLF